MILQRSSRHVFLLAVTFTVVATFLLYLRRPVVGGWRETGTSPPLGASISSYDTAPATSTVALPVTSVAKSTPPAISNDLSAPPLASPDPNSYPNIPPPQHTPNSPNPPVIKTPSILPPKPQTQPSIPQPPLAAVTTAPKTIPLDQTEAQYGIGNITKTFVVSSQKKESTKWIDTLLPEWEYVRYVTDEPVGNLRVPKNKGNEAMVYLTYIIDHYDKLPDLMVFIHAERFQWHNDDPLWDNAYLLGNLQVPYLLSQPYTNLRCVWTLGCPSDLKGINEPIPQYINGNDEPFRKHLSLQYAIAFPILFPNDPKPVHVSVPCCAQFATTRTSIRARPLSQYTAIRKWLLDTPLENGISGRIMEFSWHILFGAPAFNCPHAGECYCKLYGECGGFAEVGGKVEETRVELLGFNPNPKPVGKVKEVLSVDSVGGGEMVRGLVSQGKGKMMKGCDEKSCGSRWDWPPGQPWPKNWPYEGWNGEIRSADEVSRLRNLGKADKPKEKPKEKAKEKEKEKEKEKPKEEKKKDLVMSG